MTKILIAPTMLLLATGALAGCANDGTLNLSNGLTTSAVTPVADAAGPKADPACVQLAAQIDGLRREGTIDRLQQAAAGKSSSVQVKRAALAKQAELNKANAEFQTKCATIAPSTASTPAAPPAVKDAAKAAAKSAAATPAAKTATKTVAAAKPVMAAAPAAAAVPVTAIAPVTPSAPPREPDVVMSAPPASQN